MKGLLPVVVIFAILEARALLAPRFWLLAPSSTVPFSPARLRSTRPLEESLRKPFGRSLREPAVFLSPGFAPGIVEEDEPNQ